MKTSKIISILSCVAVWGLSSICLAEEEVPVYFDAEKVITEKDYALNDTLEFTLFDLSELKLVNNSKDIVLDKAVVKPLNKTTTKAPVKPVKNDKKSKQKKLPDNVLSALNEIQSSVENLPGHFYKTLKKHIINEAVPVTLYPENPPAYSKPLQLYVKVKSIQLNQNYLSTDGISYIQPLKIIIYGQITDKASGNVLTKFYDSAQTIFVLGKDQADGALKEVSDQMMKDFALYLRTKY